MNAISQSVKPIDLNELIQLSAVDSQFFARQFFPKTCRQEPALYDRQAWDLLDGPSRYVNMQIHRDGAKTTRLRIYAAKRIAFGIARTILVVGKSEAHALRSVRWIRKQIDYNKEYAATFKLRRGEKWQDHECEIWHGVDDHPITVLAIGITGSTRGINIDDYRPDLIIVDDVCDEENSATAEQRTKIEDLVLSALKNSLAPETECPDAKMAILQTPLNKEDVSCKALLDPEFVSVVFSCWTAETADLPVDQQESSWPARYPSYVLRREKKAAAARGKLSLFLREKECKLSDPETNDFRADWLKYYDIDPPGGVTTMSIDPVPPPTEKQIAKGLKDKDFEVFAVVTRYNDNYYLRTYEMKKGHEPDWTIMTFFSLVLRWKPRKTMVETTAYQKTLQWLLKKAMEVRKQYFLVVGFNDKNSKRNRINQGLSGIASLGKLYVKREHVEFIEQFTNYPSVSHDDVLEAVANACRELQGIAYEAEDGESSAQEYAEHWKEMMEAEKDIPALEFSPENTCPYV